jgi:ATP-binding cassette subfamily B protein
MPSFSLPSSRRSLARSVPRYGVKVLVDTLATGLTTHAKDAWLGFALLATLIAADNFLWRIACWIASYTFVAVTGDVRRDLFRHLTGHAHRATSLSACLAR